MQNQRVALERLFSNVVKVILGVAYYGCCSWLWPLLPRFFPLRLTLFVSFVSFFSRQKMKSILLETVKYGRVLMEILSTWTKIKKRAKHFPHRWSRSYAVCVCAVCLYVRCIDRLVHRFPNICGNWILLFQLYTYTISRIQFRFLNGIHYSFDFIW